MKKPTTFRSYVDELVAFRDRFWVTGWAFDIVHVVKPTVWWNGAPLDCEIAYPLRSPDVAAALGDRASACRFQISGKLPPGANVDEFEMVFQRGPLTTRRDNLYLDRINDDQYHALERRFFTDVGSDVLEIGSRARSGNDQLAKLAGRRYTGMDILEGPNVDVVGDAHDLSTYFPAESFDGVFAVSVFEHLLMPWKAALEINRVIRTGGLVYVGTHQSFPLHEVPWDYFRFSDTSWHGIFNVATGFEVVETALGEPVALVPLVQHPIQRRVMYSDAFVSVGVLARKVGAATVEWDVPLSRIVESPYPV